MAQLISRSHFTPPVWLLAAIATTLLLPIAGSAADTASHYAPYAGGRLHYESYGSGDDAVVFVHGWTCDLTFWREQAPVYENHRSLLIDLPGHGGSDKPHGPYPMEFFARGIDAALRDAGVSRAVIVGHSLGGPIAYAFLRLYPEKVKALVLVDAEITVPLASAAFREAQKLRYERNVKALSGSAGREYMASQIEQMFSLKTPEEWRERIRAKMLATPDYVRVAAVSSPSQLAVPKPGEVYPLPVLTIQASTAGRDARIASMSKIFPKLKVEKWEGHGHFLMVEDPPRFNRSLEDFLTNP